MAGCHGDWALNTVSPSPSLRTTLKLSRMTQTGWVVCSGVTVVLLSSSDPRSVMTGRGLVDWLLPYPLADYQCVHSSSSSQPLHCLQTCKTHKMHEPCNSLPPPLQTVLQRIPIHDVASASYINDDDQHLLFVKAGKIQYVTVSVVICIVVLQ